MTINDGQRAEIEAKCYLEAQGLRWVGSNFRCKCGELDLIMVDQYSLVFIEVRKRSRSRFASAAQSVDRRKQQRLGLAAKLFLQRHPQYGNFPCRFDVIAYDETKGAAATLNTPRWIKNAFQPPLS